MEKGRKIEIWNPAGEQEDSNLVLAARRQSLEGKTIGLLDNLKPSGNVIVARAGQRMAERFPGVKLLARSKPEQAAPVPEGILREFTEQCSLVFNAVAN